MRRSAVKGEKMNILSTKLKGKKGTKLMFLRR